MFALFISSCTVDPITLVNGVAFHPVYAYSVELVGLTEAVSVVVDAALRVADLEPAQLRLHHSDVYFIVKNIPCMLLIIFL